MIFFILKKVLSDRFHFFQNSQGEKKIKGMETAPVKSIARQFPNTHSQAERRKERQNWKWGKCVLLVTLSSCGNNLPSGLSYFVWKKVRTRQRAFLGGIRKEKREKREKPNCKKIGKNVAKQEGEKTGKGAHPLASPSGSPPRVCCGGEGRGGVTYFVLTSLLEFIWNDASDEMGTSTHQGGHQLIELLLGLNQGRGKRRVSHVPAIPFFKLIFKESILVLLIRKKKH